MKEEGSTLRMQTEAWESPPRGCDERAGLTAALLSSGCCSQTAAGFRSLFSWSVGGFESMKNSAAPEKGLMLMQIILSQAGSPLGNSSLQGWQRRSNAHVNP